MKSNQLRFLLSVVALATALQIATSPYTNPISSGQKFFRLAQ